MTFVRICVLLCLTTLLAACSRPVHVVEKEAFSRMASQMTRELQARKLLDSRGNYFAAFSLAPQEGYGKILFQRLSPDFMLQSDAAHDVYLGENFAATVLPDSRVKHWPNGFSIDHATQKITLHMTAIADWNGDGQEEWIVACAVEPKRGGRSRTYYLLVPPPRSAVEKLRGTVAAVNECFGLACTLYVRDSKNIQRTAADPLAPPTEVHDLTPGLQPVTEPPGAKKLPASGPAERPL